MLYDDAAEMAEYVSQAMREASKEAAVLLYSPRADPFLEELVANADRVFYSNEGQRVVSKANPRTQKSQVTLEAFT